MAVSAICSVAISADEHFKPYYKTTMDVMLSFQSFTEEEAISARAR